MATTRADLFGPLTKTKVLYQDFRDDFACDPLTGDLLLITNDKSVE
jgi:phage baseplate assembly protein W